MKKNLPLLLVIGILGIGLIGYFYALSAQSELEKVEDETITEEHAKWLESIRPPAPPEIP